MAMIVTPERVFLTTSDLIILPLTGEMVFSTMAVANIGKSWSAPVSASTVYMVRLCIERFDKHRWTSHTVVTDFKWSLDEFQWCCNMIRSASRTAYVIPLTDHLHQAVDSLMAIIY